MTDITQAHASALSAENQTETVLTGALDWLHQVNTRLIELHGEIKASQPNANGAVCLELYPCGSDCTGCPHPRWVKYRWANSPGRPARLIGSNLGAQKKDPVLSLGRLTPGYTETTALFREAKALIAERAELLEIVRKLRYFQQRRTIKGLRA